MNPLDYKSAGVDLERYRQAMDRLPTLIKRTYGTKAQQVIDLPGGFAGLFRLQSGAQRYGDPVLVSCADGVGTKVKVAAQAGRFGTVGIDLVAMCVNDCLCLGAEPLFFLDYLALPKDDPPLIAALVEGISEGCQRAGTVLLGGETAVMPGLYADGDFDMAGFCVGVVERERIIDGSAIRPGDVIVGLASSGFHSNGYSLIRKVVFEKAGLEAGAYLPDLGCTVADILLEPTRIYTEPIRSVLESPGAGGLHGVAHITGGGLRENIERILPQGCQARIDRDRWSVPREFRWLQSLGRIDLQEMFRVFNMGIGMVLIVSPEALNPIEERLTGIETFRIGQIVQEQTLQAS